MNTPPKSANAPIHEDMSRSVGGSVVAASLQSLGFNTTSPNVRLIETYKPTQSKPTVLVQSAWNFLPRSEFSRLSGNYPRSMQLRMELRRSLASHNVRRAGKVVALSSHMAELVETATGRQVEVNPVTIPIDAEFLSALTEGVSKTFDTYALVPGTVTDYKRPNLALSIIAKHFREIRTVRFAGRTPSAKLISKLESDAKDLSLDTNFGPLDRSEMVNHLQQANVVIVPSELESLGISCAEALALSSNVVASRLPSHAEISRMLGRSPIWIDELANMDGSIPALNDHPPLLSAQTVDEAKTRWARLGHTLHLPRQITVPAAARGRQLRPEVGESDIGQ